MFKVGTKFHTSEIDSDVLKPYTNQEVIALLTDKYKNFDAAYIPDKYDIAFILIKEDHNDSFNDEWKIVFFKKVMKMPDFANGTITLDNLEAMQSAGSSYEIYKELDGTFEDTIKISCELINKHRAGYTKEANMEVEIS